MQWKVLGPEPGCRDDHDRVRSLAVVHGFGKIQPPRPASTPAPEKSKRGYVPSPFQESQGLHGRRLFKSNLEAVRSNLKGDSE